MKALDDLKGRVAEMQSLEKECCLEKVQLDAEVALGLGDEERNRRMVALKEKVLELEGLRATIERDANELSARVLAAFRSTLN
ncbi:hypothetical protein LVJ94_35325 [Pendulispora rubella]|uniref:Uncharacterized protein n=1 Tax=Pendulispora rubella TaxID=2741070 RepID=A0ABZ2KYW2_9BACT